MADVRFTAEFDDSGIESTLRDIQEVTRETDKDLQKMTDSLNTGLSEAKKNAEDATSAFDNLDSSVNEASKSGNAFRGILRSVGKGIKDVANQIRIGSQGLADLITKTLQYDKIATAAAASSGKFLSVLRFLGLAIGGIVAVVGVLLLLPLLAYFTRTTEVANKLEVALGGIRAQFDVLIRRSANFGEALLAIISGDRVNGINKLGDAFRGLGEEIKNAGNSGRELVRSIQELNQSQDEFTINQATLERSIQKQRQIAEDSTKSISERIRALQEAGRIEAQIENERLRQAEENLKNVRTANVLKNGTLLVDQELAEAEAALEQERARAEFRKFQDLKALRALREESRQAAEAEKKALDELSKIINRLNSQINQLRIEELSPRDRIKAELRLALDEIDRFEQETRAAFAARKQQFNLEAEFDELRLLTRAQAERELTDLELSEIAKRADERVQEATRRKEAQEAELQRELQNIEIRKQIELTRIEQIQDASATEVELVQRRERLKLEAERNALQERLAIVEQLEGIESLQAQLIREQINLLQQQINSIENIDLSVFDRLKEKLLAALKISEADLQIITQQLQNAFGNLTSGLDAITARQIAQQDELLDAIQQRISKTEDLLAEEQRRQQQGFANNADALRESLELQQQEREKAEQRRAQLEQQAARRRLAINAAEQISEYVLAVAKLARANAGFGLPGIALTAAGAALIFKLIKEAQAIKFEQPGFREGTSYVDGRGTTQSDSISANLSVGERVVPSDINAEMGGRRLSNAEMLQIFKIGQRVKRDPLSHVMPTIIKTDQKARSMSDGFQYELMTQAYEKAAQGAAQTMIQYWKSRPVQFIDADGNTKISWETGGTKFKQIIKPSK